MEVVLVLAVLVGLAVVWQWVKRQAVQQVFSRHDHEQGRNLTDTVTQLSTSAAPDVVLDAVEAELASPSPGFGHRAATVTRVGATELRISYAPAFASQFTARLCVRPDGAGRTTGTYDVVEVRTRNGVVTEAEQLRLCRDVVLRGIARADRSTTFTDSCSRGRIL